MSSLPVIGVLLAMTPASGQLAVSDQGRAFLVNTGAVVQERTAAPGRRFGPPRTVLRPRRGERVVAAGVAGDGSGVVVLQRRRRVLAASFAGRRVALSGPRSDFAGAAVARSGAAAVVWFHHVGRRWRLEAAARGPGGRFGRPEPVSAFVRRPCCTTVSVAIGDRGDAVAAWTSTLHPGVWAAVRPAGGRFGGVQRMAALASDVPRVEVGPDGTAALLYSVQHVPLRAADGLQLHRARPGGRFGAAERVNPGGGVTTGAAAVAPGGQVLVAWVDRAAARVRVAGGEPLAPAGELGSRVAAQRVAVAAGADGRAVVAWSQAASLTPYRERAFAALRPAEGAAFGPPIALGPRARAAEPGPARLVPGGGALVLWSASEFVPRRTFVSVTRVP